MFLAAQAGLEFVITGVNQNSWQQAKVFANSHLKGWYANMEINKILQLKRFFFSCGYCIENNVLLLVSNIYNGPPEDIH